jgi:hypothetical protein
VSKRRDLARLIGGTDYRDTIAVDAEDGTVTVAEIPRRRRYFSTVAATGIVLLVATAAGVHLLFSGAPLWMAAVVALVPALVITGACVNMAERWGWMLAVTLSRESRDDADRTVLRWVSIVFTLVDGGLFGWFGDSWYDRWRRIYPAPPAWMLYVTIVVLLMLVTLIVEIVLVEIVERVRGKGVDTLNDQRRL